MIPDRGNLDVSPIEARKAEHLAHAQGDVESRQPAAQKSSSATQKSDVMNVLRA